ncbi:MAG: adenylate/guanylate cyclase domain-containing protein [Nitrospina sp.]|nr:adenylate/guanylate cyclase domain-containing protein [Nitrospina sp.]MBT3413689.1 adenylate/guanylate cyclase domain-containing protein [Nitrospina sp.]MBT4104435.1 adenylate/guanylate cyclase domain-containing protein [Nitrospina sp.]MBT4388714.1 adenylate/guanylate cyclase domain-containing protein [Nitrospina sp.]MBT4620032.1 adenylate/guanylate cyclase domain-containing protein [Nitrospina sp.]
MRENLKKYSHWFMGLGITLLTLLTYSYSPSWVQNLENLLQNSHFRLRGPVSPGPEILIAKIDEKSVDKLGRWPWPRQTMAKLTQKLLDYEARVIAFDVIFSSPQSSPESLEQLNRVIPLIENTEALKSLKKFIKESNPDAEFAKVLSQATTKAVLGYFFHFSSEELHHLSLDLRNQYFEDIKSSQFRGFLKSKQDLDLSRLPFPSAYAVESNITAFSRSAKSSGFFTFNIENDGSIRRLPLIVRYHDPASKKDYYFPPLSLRALEQFMEGTLLFRVGEYGMEEVILDGKSTITIPANTKGELEINFLGPRGTFPGFSISDLLDDSLSLSLRNKVKGKIILVGATATALEDIRVTAFDPKLPGIEIHASIIDNILRNNFLSQPSWTALLDSLYLLLIGIFLTAVYSRIQPKMSLLIWVLSTGALFYLSHWLFLNKGFWLTDVYALFENTVIASAIMLNRFVDEGKQKLFIKKVFGQYLSPRVVKELLNDPSKLKLGGEQKELSALFTDLEGFTTFSEKLGATELVDLLNTYLTEMTDILLQYDGTLDRYDGDAIKAFFGAPIYFDDHAKRACWVCIDMQNRLKEMRVKFKEQGKPELLMRVGLNTGSMVIGNMGSTTRMMYGMNGDSVNLCARLEGANKQYGTYSLISEFTYQAAKEFIEVRELDTLRVVGRATPIKIYELLGKTGEIEESVKKTLPFYNSGLNFYKNRDWENAGKCFEEGLQANPEDGPCRVYRDRCKEYLDTPPPEDWDGVFNLQKK